MQKPALLADNGVPAQTIALQPGSQVCGGGDRSGDASDLALPPVGVDRHGTPCTIGIGAFDVTSIFCGTFKAQ